MGDDEGFEFDVCVACGADLSDTTTAFGLPTDEYLCLDCSLARGGEFDEIDEIWIRPPDVAGLAHAES